MEVRQLPLSDIKPYEKNPRRKKNIQKVIQSIKDFGFQQPIVTDPQGNIIVGHSRYAAAKELKMELVPVVIANLSLKKLKPIELQIIKPMKIVIGIMDYYTKNLLIS